MSKGCIHSKMKLKFFFITCPFIPFDSAYIVHDSNGPFIPWRMCCLVSMIAVFLPLPFKSFSPTYPSGLSIDVNKSVLLLIHAY